MKIFRIKKKGDEYINIYKLLCHVMCRDYLFIFKPSFFSFNGEGKQDVFIVQYTYIIYCIFCTYTVNTSCIILSRNSSRKKNERGKRKSDK